KASLEREVPEVAGATQRGRLVDGARDRRFQFAIDPTALDDQTAKHHERRPPTEAEEQYRRAGRLEVGRDDLDELVDDVARRQSDSCTPDNGQAIGDSL